MLSFGLATMLLFDPYIFEFVTTVDRSIDKRFVFEDQDFWKSLNLSMAIFLLLIGSMYLMILTQYPIFSFVISWLILTPFTFVTLDAVVTEDKKGITDFLRQGFQFFKGHIALGISTTLLLLLVLLLAMVLPPYVLFTLLKLDMSSQFFQMSGFVLSGLISILTMPLIQIYKASGFLNSIKKQKIF